MFTIRQSQYAALRRNVRTRFASAVVAQLALDAPDAVRGLDPAEIDARLARSLDCADRYKVDSARDLRAFLRLCFLVADDFSTYAPFDRLLTAHAGDMAAVFREASADRVYWAGAGRHVGSDEFLFLFCEIKCRSPLQQRMSKQP